MKPGEIQATGKKIRLNDILSRAARKRGDTTRAAQYDAENRALWAQINAHREEAQRATRNLAARFL